MYFLLLQVNSCFCYCLFCQPVYCACVKIKNQSKHLPNKGWPTVDYLLMLLQIVTWFCWPTGLVAVLLIMVLVTTPPTQDSVLYSTLLRTFWHAYTFALFPGGYTRTGSPVLSLPKTSAVHWHRDGPWQHAGFYTQRLLPNSSWMNDDGVMKGRATQLKSGEGGKMWKKGEERWRGEK